MMSSPNQRQPGTGGRPGGLRPVAIAACVWLSALPAAGQAQQAVFASVEEIATPAGPGAQEPALFALPDGRVSLIWTEPTSTGFAVRTATGDESGWGVTGTVASSDDLFVNWADFPSIAVLGDGTVAAHWLKENGTSSYAYDVNLALSRDGGVNWSQPFTPHRDGTASQHGFVTLLPVADDRFAVIWLDGRAYRGDAPGTRPDDFADAMQLRAAFVGSDGIPSPETALDIRTCTCCQTSAAVAQGDTLLVVYRDRTADEIRDISIVRMVAGIWSEPRTVHADGWEISGCPVNGPAIDAAGEMAVVAWFTAADDVPAVNVAFSHDAGGRFDPPFRVDGGDAAGRVDVVMLDDGSAIISGVEWAEAGEALQVCLARAGTRCGPAQTIALNTAPGSMNFPRMARTGDAVFVAWSQPGEAGAPDGIRLVKARLQRD